MKQRRYANKESIPICEFPGGLRKLRSSEVIRLYLKGERHEKYVEMKQRRYANKESIPICEYPPDYESCEAAK